MLRPRVRAGGRAFRNQHPGVRIQITTGVPEELIAKMERGEVDIIYLLDEPLYNNDWNKLLEERGGHGHGGLSRFGALPGGGPHRLEELLDKPSTSPSGTPITAACWTCATDFRSGAIPTG
mgnify:CR=1 FL=1